MRRGAKLSKAKLEAKRPAAPKSRKDEGVRVRDLEKRLGEALEQQTATAEVLRIISSSQADTQPVFDNIVESAVRLCAGVVGAVFTSDGERIYLRADFGSRPETREAVRSHYPIPLDRAHIAGRAILDADVVHVPDIEAPDAAPEGSRVIARMVGYRSALASPMFRAGRPIGVIFVCRRDPGPFSDEQVRLLRTFADQAVIAIENVRLFNETKEALEQQTATSDILRVISSSPTDVQTVFETIARSATTLCEADLSGLYSFDGDLIHFAAEHGRTPVETAAAQRAFPQPPSRLSVTARAILTAAVVQVADVSEEPELADSLRMFRTVLSVPMLRDGRPLGAITVARRVVRPFTNKQIELLQTFADQAVIAIENVRLFNETKEALEQQTATSEILRVIASSPTDMQPVFETIVRNAARLCNGIGAALFRTDGVMLEHPVNYGTTPDVFAEIARHYPMRLDASTAVESSIGKAILTRSVVQITDAEDPSVPSFTQSVARAVGFRSQLSVPMLKDGEPVGGIVVVRREVGSFTKAEVELLKTFADQAVIAIENVRLFNETKEALERQIATSEILRVISSSPTDIQPVFDTIMRSTLRLCGAKFAVTYRYDGDQLYVVAHESLTPEMLALLKARYPQPPSRETATGVSVLERQIVHIPDGSEDDVPAASREFASQQGWGSMLAVPLLRDGQSVGNIAVARVERQPFSEQQIALVQTFADQAVIAIENVRLFKELETRNAELTTALERQTATSEILRVISGAQQDAQAVFDTIVQSAVRLCRATTAAVFRVEDSVVYHPANYGGDPEALAAARARYPRPVDIQTMPGMIVLARSVVQIPDSEEVGLPDHVRQVGRILGFRSVVGVPMLRESEAVGALLVTRREPGRFSDAEVELLKTFSDQAVIAIENVRLFKELQEKNQALTTAHAQVSETLEQQTATSEILRVISQSPTDIQPVFDTIIERAVRLCDARLGALLRFDGQMIHLAAHAQQLDAESLQALQTMYPMPASTAGVSGRALLSGTPVHVRDMREDPELAQAPTAQVGHRTVLSVPMMREGTPIGAITVARARVVPFSDRQVELLQTFADQAVIAIENVRLFTELQTSNRELTTALDTQTATSDILRVISLSQTDVQPVFDAIVTSAVKLLRGFVAAMSRIAGDRLELAAFTNSDSAGDAAVRSAFPQLLDSDWPHSRVVRDRVALNVTDARSDPQLPEAIRNVAAVRGYQSLVVLPILRHDDAVGAISVTRRELGGFTDDEIALLKTFADQAVIAIENVRLFTELQEKNRALTQTHAQVTEALDQQTATAEILGVISSSPTDIQPVFAALATSAARLCDAFDAAIHRMDGDVLRLVAHEGPIEPDALLPVEHGTLAGQVVRERRAIQVADMQAETHSYPLSSEFARNRGFRTILGVPLLRGAEVLGIITIRRTEVRQFTDKQAELLKTFADQAVIAIENARLFNELQARNRDLTTALDRQTTTADVLRIIAQSPTELQPVLDAIAASAVRLCTASDVVIERLEGDRFYNAAHAGSQMKGLVGLPLPLTRRFPGGRAVLDRRRIVLDDIQLVAETEYPDTLELLKINTVHSCAEIPLLSEGKPLGNLAVLRAEVRPFTDAEIALLETFADQAVIAIENVRLFKELEARTQDLTRSVGELRALSEVGQAISSTLDLQTVLRTIVARATQLSGTDAGVIYEYDEHREIFVPRATEHLEAEIVETMLATPVRRGEGATGQLAQVQGPIQVVDILAAPAESRVRDALVRAGYRALLAVPLVREDHLLGGLTVIRKATGAFAPDVLELLQTFATQSALAIQNARLFRELEEKGRELEAASQHKSEFLANMSHELRTPLNAIIGFSEVLSDRMFGELNEKQEEYLKDIYASGTHLLSLINDILDLSKIEAGRMELELTDFDLPTALDSALTLVRERAGRRGIRLESTIDERLGEVRADERKIRQVVLNLLSNAIKFTPEGGRIEVAAVPKDGSVEVSVSDTGVGIAPEDQEAVFEEFRQVGTAEKKAEGTGLGLTLCRKFIELHGGKIWVKSEVGVGSTFTFTLPVHRGE